MALKGSQEVVATALEPVVHQKRGVVVNVVPPKQRWKLVEEKALVDANDTD